MTTYTDWQETHPGRLHLDFCEENVARLAAGRPPCAMECPSNYMPTHVIKAADTELYTCGQHLTDGLMSVIHTNTFVTVTRL
jgi:hypothetical protein